MAETSTTNPEGSSSGYRLLQSKTTLQEILAVTTSFEKTARDFYAGLAPKVSKNIRYLVEELAEEEAEHYRLFSDLSRDPAIQDLIRQEIDTPVEDRKFSDYVQIPDLGENPDDQTVLQYALGREDAAMKQYHDLARQAAPGPIQELFEFLANEETKHKVALERIYYEIVYDAGRPGSEVRE